MPPKAVSRLVDAQWPMPTEAEYVDVVDPADVRRIVGRVPAMSAGEVTELSSPVRFTTLACRPAYWAWPWAASA